MSFANSTASANSNADLNDSTGAVPVTATVDPLANTISHLLLLRSDEREVLPDPITVTFTSQFTDDKGAVAAANDATHIKVTPEIDLVALNKLKKSTNSKMFQNLANNIGRAKDALNRDEDDKPYTDPLGVRGGKKSKSKKHPKSKKIKSVRRR
jgi:hypothetical protein